MTGRIGRIVAVQGAENVDGLNRRSMRTHRNDRRQYPVIHFKVGKAKDERVRVAVCGGANSAVIGDTGGFFGFRTATVTTKLTRHGANDLIARCHGYRGTAIARNGGHAPLGEEHGGKEKCVPNSVHCITRTP